MKRFYWRRWSGCRVVRIVPKTPSPRLAVFWMRSRVATRRSRSTLCGVQDDVLTVLVRSRSKLASQSIRVLLLHSHPLKQTPPLSYTKNLKTLRFSVSRWTSGRRENLICTVAGVGRYERPALALGCGFLLDWRESGLGVLLTSRDPSMIRAETPGP